MAKKIESYGEILTLFIFETLAFTSFTLGNSILLYLLFGLITLLLILFFNTNRLKNMDYPYFFIFLIPLVIFAILSGFSKFSLNPSNHFTMITNILVPIVMLIFISLGYLSRSVEGFKISNGMTVIYAGILIITLLSIIYALIKYGPFYTMIYEGKYIYYEGKRFPIWDNIPFLMGIKYIDVSIQYFQLFPTLLFTSMVGLKFISPKKEKKKFIIYSIYASVGFLSMIFTINKINIITSVLVILFLLFLVFVPKRGKVLKPIAYTVLGIVAVLGLIFFINAQSSWGFANGLQEVIKGNAFLNRLFNANRFSTPMVEALDGCLTGDKIFGFKAVDDMSNIFLFDNIITTGFIGALCFFIFLGFMVINLVKYYTKSKDDMLAKNLVVAFICTFFIYSLFALDSQPYSHYTNYIPMQQNPMFLITLILMGYVIMDRKRDVNTEVVEIINNNIKEDVNIIDADVKNEKLNPEVKDTNDDEIELVPVEDK